MLGINELNEHGNQNADNHIAFINGLLSEYGRDSSCLDFVVADNAAVNLKTARNLTLEVEFRLLGVIRISLTSLSVNIKTACITY